ncbi:MAG: hypothetical protein ACM3ZF_06630 [Mycobacterium leprae]
MRDDDRDRGGGLFDRLRDAVTGGEREERYRDDDEGRRYRDDDEGRRYRDEDD